MVLKRKESPLRIKSEAYSIRISNLYHFLLDTKNEKIVANQIYRSGTSIGANIAEANMAQSMADFSSKMYIALKEANETLYWLKLLSMSEYLDNSSADKLVSDCKELVKMLVSTTKKTSPRQPELNTKN
jgi:four helix bundle protein